MLAVGPVIGQSGRWRFDSAATAMGWSPDMGQEIRIERRLFDRLTGRTQPKTD
jgi:hypothetical protein